MKMFQKSTDGLLNFMDLRSPVYKSIYWIMFAFLFCLSLICILPVIWVLLSSFKDTAEMYSVPPTLFPKSIDLGKIGEIWRIIHLGKYILNSLYIIIGCWAVDITINGFAGYVLSKIRPKGSALLETLIFWTMMLPGISMVPLYMTFVDVPLFHINLTGTFFPVWIMAGCNAFNIFLFRNFFNGIPKDYFDAARIDGCGNLGIFFRIILPLSKPLIAVVSILSFTGSWNNFMWPYITLGNTSLEPVAVMLYQVSNSSAMLQDNQLMLLMLLSIIPPLVIYSIFSKQIMGGFNLSGIKG